MADPKMVAENPLSSSENKGYVNDGPLTKIFGNPTAKVLDQSLIVGNMEQTISMLMESTGLSYKTVDKVVDRLISTGLMKFTRKIGNAKAYSFSVENHLSELINCAQKIQIVQLREEAGGS